MSLPDQLLALPAEVAIRLIALDLLAATVRARRRLDDPSDTEALHDFRVALRRLRSCLRTYRAQLDRSVSRGLRRRLRRFTRAAGDSRDLEVQIHWLQEHLGSFGPGEAPGAHCVLNELEARKVRADQMLYDVLDWGFAETATKMKQRLRDYRTQLDLKQVRRDTAGALIADRVRAQAGDLEQSIQAVGLTGAMEPAHQARIAAKRVRYTLEPIESLVRETTPILAQLKSLQDILGELHDSQVFQHELGNSLVRSAQLESVWLTDQLRRREIAAIERLRQEWLTAAPGQLLAQIREVANTIARRSGITSFE